MNVKHLCFRTLLTSAGVGLALVPVLWATSPLPSQATLQDSPKALVDQAWQIVQRNYVERTFNHQDWQKVRSQYLASTYNSKEAAYQAIQTMLATLKDPYTRFLSPADLKDLTSNLSGDFVGVGLTVSLDPATREWIVEKAFDESPAATAGIQPQDIIVSLNGKATAKIDPANAAPYLIGPVGSKVELQVRRKQQSLAYTLVREHINLNPLTYRVIPSSLGSVGYIRLPIFTTKSATSMEQALKQLESQKVTGYVLDLRGNPGGVLDAGIAIARQWLSGGTIVSVQERDQPKVMIQATQQALSSRPLAVLVDQDSASSSEILAAALQENRRAVLVGAKTFGKGLVQSFEPLQDGSGVLVTIAQYFTPQGHNINHIGITPDVSTDTNPPNSTDFSQDRQYQAGLAALARTLGKAAPTTRPQ
ncbi:MAG TPA: S41 family peptidase [Stenomitos sp.]